MSSRRRCWRRRSRSTRTTVRPSESLPPAIHSAPTWVGRTWQAPCRLPNALRWRRSRGTARTLGRTTRWAASICSRGVSKTRWPSSSWRYTFNPNFSLAQGYYGLALSYCGRWKEADEAARRALRLSPRDPFAAVYAGIAAYAQFIGRNYNEAMQLAREAIRQRGDFVGAHRVLTAAAGMAGQTEVAMAALQELRRAQPNISLAWIADQMPIKLDADREHYLEAFRRAGLD